MRLIELMVSVRRMRHAEGRVVSEPRLFPLMALLHAGLVFAPIAEVILLERPFSWTLGLGALSLLLLATGLRVWTLRSIGSAWNVRIVRPAGDRVSTAGPYAWIRHPNYLVVIMEILALPLVHTAWLSAIALSSLNALVLFHRIRNEEATLMQVPEWKSAMQDKARFVPGVF